MSLRANFTFTQLEYVMAVHKTGNFSKAAEQCNVTQPTLSMQIQKLEEEIGVTIFDRSKKPVLATPVGAKLLEQIQTILYEARKIDSIITSDSEEEVHGELTVGVIPTIAPYVLPNLLPQIEKDFPKLSLNILELQTQRIIEALDTDEIDVGLLATPINRPKVHEYPLFYEPFFVHSRKDHPIAKSKRIKYNALEFTDIWLLEEGHCLRNQVIDVCAIRETRSEPSGRFKFESGSLETLKSLIASYGGYTLLPQLATQDLKEGTTIIPFERPIPSREIGLVFRRAHYKSQLIEALGEAILASIPNEVKKLRAKDLEVLPVEK